MKWSTSSLGFRVVCEVDKKADLKTALPQPLAMNTLSPEEKAAGWKLLFDGKTTDGWRSFRPHGSIKAPPPVSHHWHVIDGALCAVGGYPKEGRGDIVTEETFGAFILECDYRVLDPDSNSGILYRVQETADSTWRSGIEYKIVDNNRSGDTYKSGSAFGLYQPSADPKTGKPIDATHPRGEWNHVKIVSDGNHVEHWLNGVQYLEFEIGSEDWQRRVEKAPFKPKSTQRFAKSRKGHIAMQGDHSTAQFRNIKLRKLNDANPEPAEDTTP